MADLQRRDPNTAVSRTEDSGRWRLSMSSILILSFGSLISVSLLLVLGFTLVGATRNTVNLLRERAELGIALIAKEVDTHLQSASNQASFVASMVESGRIDVADRDRLATLMFGAMAADPAIGAVAFVFPDGEAEVVDRLADPARPYKVQLRSGPPLLPPPGRGGRSRAAGGRARPAITGFNSARIRWFDAASGTGEATSGPSGCRRPIGRTSNGPSSRSNGRSGETVSFSGCWRPSSASAACPSA